MCSMLESQIHHDLKAWQYCTTTAGMLTDPSEQYQPQITHSSWNNFSWTIFMQLVIVVWIFFLT